MTTSHVQRCSAMVQLLSVLILSLSVLGCSTHGCQGSTKGSMSMRPLNELTGAAQAKLRVGGIAASWPIPIIENGTVRAAIFVYATSHDPTNVWQGAPDRLLVLDAETGEVLRDKNTKPVEIGPVPPAEGALPGSPRRAVASMDELLALRNRISDLAPEVWGAFGEDRVALTPQVRADVAEYLRMMDKIEPGTLMPYYRYVGRAFYDWAKRVQDAAPR